MEQAASQILRAIRGTRSQRWLARRLGYKGNPMTDWERGQRFPTAEEALRAASLLRLDVEGAFRRLAPNAAPPVGKHGPDLPEWLRKLRGSASLQELALRSDRSRFTLARWFSGRAKPRLPDFLRLIDALTGRAPEWVAGLVPIEQVPALRVRFAAAMAARRLAFDAPWTEAVLRLLETAAYRRLRSHQEGWIAACLGIGEEEEQRCLAQLRQARLIERRGRRYVINQEYAVDTQGGKKALHRLKQHWTTVAAARLDAPRNDDLFAYNVVSVSRLDLARIREKLRATFREIRIIVAASRPEELAAILNLQLITFDPAL